MLSCSCDTDYCDWFYYSPEDFTELKTKRRRRCISCNRLIWLGNPCLQFERYRDPRGYYEENRFGDEVPMSAVYMCDECGEIFLNLTAIGYCINLGGHMKDALEEYWDITGFEPKATQ